MFQIEDSASPCPSGKVIQRAVLGTLVSAPAASPAWAPCSGESRTRRFPRWAIWLLPDGLLLGSIRMERPQTMTRPAERSVLKPSITKEN